MKKIFWINLARRISLLNEWVGRSVSWLTTVLVLLVCFDVITRYLANSTQAWIMELEWHLFALIFLLGAGFAFKHDRHVRVDLFYAKISAKNRAYVDLIGGIVFLLPWSLLLMYFSTIYAWSSYQIGETSPDPGGLPARYLIKFSIALGMGFLFLQGVASIIDAAIVISRTGKKTGEQ